MRVVLLLCLLLPGPAAAEEEPVAALTQVSGEVMVLHGTAWTAVSATPVNLFSGDKVTTGRGRAEIRYLRDDSTLVLDVGTQLTITEVQEGTAGKMLRRIEIFLGDVWFKLQQGLNRKTELVTPTAVGGLRGTQGLVRVKNEAQSEFTLTEGELEVSKRTAPGSGAAGETIVLRVNQMLRVRRDQPMRARAVRRPPVRPAVSIPVERLPQPPKHRRRMIGRNERPPTVKPVPPVPRPRATVPRAEPPRPSRPPKVQPPQPPKSLEAPKVKVPGTNEGARRRHPASIP